MSFRESNTRPGPIRRLLELVPFGRWRAVSAEESPPPPRSLLALAEAAEDELENNILPFWLAHARNPGTGGFWGEVTAGLRPRRTRVRGAILACRILWTFSATSRRRRPDPAWLEMARYAFKDLIATFRDGEHGGLVWSADPSGAPRDSSKQTYAQTFGIYGFAEFHRATGDRSALDEAIGLFRHLEACARDHIHGGYVDCLDRDWSPFDPTMQRPLGRGAGKSINTMLHVVEAYANLYRAWPDPGLRQALAEALETILVRSLDGENARLIQYFDATWTPVSDRTSYGHDIEFGWLAVDAAAAIGDAGLAGRVSAAALSIAGTVLQGADGDGGLVGEIGPGGVTDPTKYWWTQAEAATGFLDAFELSGDESFLEATYRSWGLISTRLVDRRRGDWFASTTRDGRPDRRAAKISFWKCPYHSARACLEISERARRLAER